MLGSEVFGSRDERSCESEEGKRGARYSYGARCMGMSKTTSIINDLIETLRDGQEGFRAAAEDVSSPDLKALFREFSQQRGQFVTELQVAAKNYGEDQPTTTGSVAGALHRGWIDLKSALASRDEHAILAECERGEDVAVAEFRKAIGSGDLSGDVLVTVTRQAAAVKAAHDRVRGLRDALATK
jgi:uncharacterized protein (TIGR02284 family)